MNPHDHYRALVDSSDVAIIAKNLESIVISWNRAAEHLFGYSEAEMVGQSIRLLIPEDRQQEEDDILARIVAGERVEQFVTQRLHKDGHLISVFVTVSPVKSEDGKIVGASKMARDAADYLTAQRKLEASERRFRLLADNISQFAWIADAGGDIHWYNQRWFDFTGTTMEEMAGYGWTKCHDPEHVERVLGRYRRSMESGEEWEDIFPLRAADGSWRWFLSRAVPIRDEQGIITQWFGTNTDITEQREQAAHVRLLLREVTHRSKNLLTTVQVLARRTAGDDSDFVERFEQRVTGLARNQDLLIKGHWRQVAMTEMVERQLGFLGDSRSQVSVSGPAVELTSASAEALSMAIHELTTNSLKYGALSVPEGRVAIDWKTEPGTLGLRISWQESGGPPVVAPQRKGFGTTLICDVPRMKMQAKVEMDFQPDGLVWSLAAPGALAAENTPTDSPT